MELIFFLNASFHISETFPKRLQNGAFRNFLPILVPKWLCFRSLNGCMFRTSEMVTAVSEQKAAIFLSATWNFLLNASVSEVQNDFSHFRNRCV